MECYTLMWLKKSRTGHAHPSCLLLLLGEKTVLCLLCNINPPSLSFFILPSLPLSLSQGALVSAEPILRCAAGEALGRMSQVGGDTNFVAQIAQTSFETLKSTRDPVTRTGHSLVLGCLHRYVGGMGSGQHLQTSVSLLQQLSEEVTSPTMQVCACVWK